MKKTTVNKLKTATTYNILWISIFLILFIQFATDGNPTTGMFVIVSLVIGMIITVIFMIVRPYFKERFKLFGESMALYLLAEIIIFCMVKEVSFFGLLYKLNLISSVSGHDTKVLREKTEVFYSSANAFSGIVIFLKTSL